MRRFRCALAFLALGCDEPGTKVTQPEPAPAASTPVVDAGVDAALPEIVTGPDGTEKTVYALLRGEGQANRFPLYATDDGKPVDHGLRDEIAPQLKGRIDIVSIEGGPEAAVKQILKAHMARFMGCYQRGLTNNPNLSGRMYLKLTLGENGRTTDGKAWGEVPDSRVQSCTLERVRQLEFPKPEKAGDRLTITLVLISER